MIERKGVGEWGWEWSPPDYMRATLLEVARKGRGRNKGE